MPTELKQERRKKMKKRHGVGSPLVELLIDNFAGGGGASEGIEKAIGRAVDLAINHDDSALTMHEFNHANTVHLCDSVWRVDPVKACGNQPVGLAWFSPDCCHFSKAKGSVPVKRNIRCLAWVVVRWAIKKRPRIIMLENVAEFLQWSPLIPLTDENGVPVLDAKGKEQFRPDPAKKGETFKRWVRELKIRGYKVDWKVLDAADYGAPTHRKRLFIVARCDGDPIKWPKPTHGPGRKKPWRTAAECIDWSIPAASIFMTRAQAKKWAKQHGMKGVPQRPLKPKTLRRIALGIKRYVLDNPHPFIVPLTHAVDRRNHSLDEPFPTVTGANRGELALVTPVLTELERSYKDDPNRSVGRPLNTITARPKGGKHALVAALLTKHYGGVVGHEVDKPVGTITKVDHHSLTTAHLIKMRGDSNGVSVTDPMPTVTSGAGAARPAGAAHAMGIAAASLIRMNHGDKQWAAVDKPLGTVTAGGLKFGLVYAFLTKYSGTAIGASLNDPMHTVTTKDRFNLITVKIDGDTYAIADICMRMLKPRELARAQGFGDDYILTGSTSNQVAKIGNSVSPPVVEALVAANWTKPKRKRICRPKP